MALDKADLKIGVFEDLGSKFDDMQEDAEREIYRAQGASVGFKKSAELVVAITAKVKDDLDANVLDLEESKLVISYLHKAVQALHDKAATSRQNVSILTGRRQGLLEAVVKIRKEQDAEEGKKSRRAREEAEDVEEDSDEEAEEAEDTVEESPEEDGKPTSKRKRMRGGADAQDAG